MNLLLLLLFSLIKYLNIISTLFCSNYVSNFSFLIDNEIHLYVMLIMNLLILFYVQIEVKRIKKSQFNKIQMMLKCCVIIKIIMQSFHLHDNIFFNNYN